MLWEYCAEERIGSVCVYPELLINHMLFSGYIKEDSISKKTIEAAILKVSIRILVCPLLFVSHSCIILMLELD